MKKSAFWSMIVVIFILLSVVATLWISRDRSPALIADVYKLTEQGMSDKLGTIEFFPVKDGLYVIVNAHGFTPGQHGFHIHETGSCQSVGSDGKVGRGLAAGSHYDPHETGMHAGPGGGGHSGDMPLLVANNDGVIKTTFTINGFTTEEVVGRAVIIHDEGDNYSDQPKPLGGAGGRFACGVLEYYH